MKCQKCGTEYDSNFCPNCGAKAGSKSIKRKVGLIIGIVLSASTLIFAATMGILFGEETPETSSTSGITSSAVESEEEIKYIEVTADELWNAFYENEVLAEETYTGQYVKVTGIVSEINSADVLTSANVLLEVEDAMFGCVQCNFNSKNSKALAKISKGQKITIYGLCDDLSLNVMVNSCEIK